jgi:hypothetical protein
MVVRPFPSGINVLLDCLKPITDNEITHIGNYTSISTPILSQTTFLLAEIVKFSDSLMQV